MLGRSLEGSASSDGKGFEGIAAGTQLQFGTQITGNKVSIDTFVDRFIDHAKKLASKRKSGQEEKLINNIKAAVRQLADERRRERVFSFLRSTAEKDQAAKVAEFYVAWCQLTSLLEEEEQVEYRFAGLRLAIDILCSQTVSTLYVSVLYDQFAKEIQLCDGCQVLRLMECQNETFRLSSISNRWTHCSLLLLKHLLGSEQITKNGSVLSSTEFVRELVYDWMLRAATFDIFGAVITVVENLSLNDLIDKFLNEYAFEDIVIEEKRTVLTWKCISLARIVDSKRLSRIIHEVAAAWPKRRGVATAGELITSVHHLVRVARDHPNVAKMSFTLFKNNPGKILRSEFGFLFVLGLCKIERYKSSVVMELTKTFQKLWNFKEDVHRFGWIESSGLGDLVDVVEDQVTCLIQRLGEDLEAWQMLSEATVLLLQSLLKLPSTKEITIVDGRVADGSPIWMFASKALAKLIISKKLELGTHLAMLIECVSTSSTSIAFIYIDMLLDIVRNGTLEVLNNWREVEVLLKRICYMSADISVSLVRCLMPIISNRPQLREQLLLSVKGSLLNSRHVKAVIPILMLLFRSFSKRSNIVPGSQMSQSFATFSSQSLQAMGCKRKTDERVCLEVTGLLKRCLTQWAPTKMAVYLGFAEEGARNTAMAGQCLDMLVSHAATAPEWKSDTMVTLANGVVTLVEPLPQLVQAMQCLLSEDVVTDVSCRQAQIGANVQKSAEELIDSWVRKACSNDVHDLGVDKLSEWNPTTPNGCANLLFSRMMLNLYDVLIEHVWSQFRKSHRLAAVDQITSLLSRRKELDEVVQEKYVRRKELKVGSNEGGPILELKQADVLVRASTVTQIFESTIPQEATSIEELSEVNGELMAWAIDRALALSQSLLDGFHPLHSMLCGSGSTISLASYLLDYYTGCNCGDWIESLANTPSKTKALDAYANIIQYLSTKYQSQPLRILPIWNRIDLNVSSMRSGEKLLTANGSLVRHCHLFMVKLLPTILTKDRGEGVQKKRIGLELERQAKAVFKICAALMKMMDNPKCFMTIFNFTMAMLEKNVVANNLTLRELLKWLCALAVKCADTDHTVERVLNSVADDLLQVLSEESDDCKFKFVEHASQATICDFLASFIDRSLVGVHSIVSFAATFQAKDQRMDEVLVGALNKCDHCCELTCRLLPLHSQFAVQRERLVQTLTTLFSAIQEPVDLMLNNVRNVPEMVEWKSLAVLSKLLKDKLQAIMVIADEHVGTFDPEEMKPSRKKTTRKDEVIYVKYVRAREALQSRVLRVSEALKEEQLNFQVKKNAIGMRDFRINLDVLKTRVLQIEDEEPRRKKRATQSTERNGEQENDVDMAAISEENGTTEGEEKHCSRLSTVF